MLPLLFAIQLNMFDVNQSARRPISELRSIEPDWDALKLSQEIVYIAHRRQELQEESQMIQIRFPWALALQDGCVPMPIAYGCVFSVCKVYNV